MDAGVISGDRSRTTEELTVRAAKAATGLAGLGLGEGDALAIMLRNDFAFFEAAGAAAALGAYAVPLNWHYKAAEAGFILTDCAARALVIHADLLPQVAAGIPEGVKVLVVETPPEIRAAYDLGQEACRLPAGATGWDSWLDGFPPWSEAAPASRVNMIYTSGTTGRPKGVRREPMDEAAMLSLAAKVEAGFGIAAGQPVRAAMPGPLYHSAPNFFGLYALQQGSLIVLQPRFDAGELLRLIEKHRLSHMHMVPTMFVRLLRLPDEVRARCDLSSLEFVIHGAAPCPAGVKRAMIEWWGPVINEYYGSTETGLAVFHTSAEALARPGTVGRVMDGNTIRIYDDAGAELGPGEIGEVYVGFVGWTEFTYHGRDQDRRDIERDGLTTVGDIGYVDEDGYLFLCDRKSDMVISGGVNIYPAEIEMVLVTMPGVRDCAVFGIPHEEFGESLCACVEPEDGAELTAEAVKSYLAEHVADFKVPHVVEFHDDLPREDSGKIFKRKLRDPHWQGTERNI